MAVVSHDVVGCHACNRHSCMARPSLFLDVDGTLLELVGHPDAVTVPAALPQVLQRLDDKLHGALVLVSGRNIAAIDQMLSPYRGTAVGVHGLECRHRGGQIEHHPLALMPAVLRQEIVRIVREYPGAFVEDKGSAIAVHERGDIAAADALADALAALCARRGPGWHCLPGHRVVEIKPSEVNKGTGLESVMRNPQFAGTLPLVVGDDVTDLDMFAAGTRFGGMTVAVGDRITRNGNLHLRSPVNVLRFLKRWSESNRAESMADVEALVREAATA
ncbi:MAG: trehalose-phosphatase [Betaproteobacteria bacterium]|nr:trehalose-phosphatase [Betaproteobacteria bacterium]